jgi:hypothetical protein
MAGREFPEHGPGDEALQSAGLRTLEISGQ